MPFAQLDDAIENCFPVTITREVVVGNEVGGDSRSVVGADQSLHVVGAAIARLATLYVDDGAEAAAERTAAAAIERADISEVAPDELRRQIGRRLIVERRQMVNKVVERCERSLVGSS